MGNYTYTIHNPAEFTDDDIAVGLELGNAISLEAIPEDPPTPLEQAIASNRSVPERMRRVRVRAWAEDGTLVGSTGVGIDPEHDDNPDMIGGAVQVLASHRRNGVGLQLAAYFVALAKKENRTRIVTETNGRMPSGLPFCEVFGAQKKQWTHINHLPLDTVDRPMLERWVTDGPTRAEGYEICGWDGRVPEEHIDKFMDAVLVMNTAPRDDLEMNDFTLTPDEIRERDDQLDAVGYERWQLIARRVSDDAWAGIHDVSFDPNEPEVCWVGATGVRPEHRGHALGKWLKAVMTLRVLDEKPDVKVIRTGNADSNDAMLGINHAMGYVPWIDFTTWEISTEAAEKYLAERGIQLPEV